MAETTTTAAAIGRQQNEDKINDIVFEYLQSVNFDECARTFQNEVAQQKRRQAIEAAANQSLREEITAKKEELLKMYDEGGRRDEFFQKFSDIATSVTGRRASIVKGVDDTEHASELKKLQFSLQLRFVIPGLIRRSTRKSVETNVHEDKSIDDNDGARVVVGDDNDNDGGDDNDDDVVEDDSMQKFKHYLKTRGSSLTNDPEYLPYFALPYIKNPIHHVTFKKLFNDTWVAELRQRLDEYLTESAIEGSTNDSSRAASGEDGVVESKLVQMYNDAHVKNPTEELSAQLHWERQKLLRMQDNYQKLMHIATELLSALESSVKGDEVNLSRVMDNCLQAFPELFAGGSRIDVTAGPSPNATLASLRASNPNPAASRHRANAASLASSAQSTTPEPERTATPLLRSKTQDMILVSLDYKSIKRDLIESPPRLKMFILQALRWRLTRSNPGEQRQSVLSSYVAYDILGTEGGDYGDAVVVLITSQTVELRQSMSRLVNAFASLTAGRSYLASHGRGANHLLHAVMDNVRYNKPEAVTLDMSLSTLQKLSLRRQLQSTMINGDLIECLMTMLEDDDALSDYALEYTVALLMNLCLRTAGKERCTRCPRRVLNILNNLLGNQNPEIIPYINGTLYSLLTVPKIKREAANMGLEDMLNCYMEDSAPEMRRQLEFILKQLASDDQIEETTSDYEDEDDDDEEQDVLEDELDKDDVVLVIPGELQGEALLTANYSLHALKQRQKEKQEEMLLARPGTPRVQPASAVRRRSSIQTMADQQQQLQEQLHQLVSSTTTAASDDVQSDGQTGVTDKDQSAAEQTVAAGRHLRTPLAQQAQPIVQTPSPTSNLNLDQYASRVLTEVVGIEKPVTEAVGFPPVLPRESEKLGGSSVNEYVVAFSSRPKIPRTPEHSGRRSQSPYFDRSSFRDGL